MSLSLQELAGDTARRTDEVGASSLQISAAVGDIHRELGAQNLEVDQMVGEIG